MSLSVAVRGSFVLRYVHLLRPFLKAQAIFLASVQTSCLFRSHEVPEKNNILSEVSYKSTERRNVCGRAKAYCCVCDYDMMMITMMISVLTAATTVSCLFDAGGTLLTHSAPNFCRNNSPKFLRRMSATLICSYVNVALGPSLTHCHDIFLGQ